MEVVSGMWSLTFPWFNFSFLQSPGSDNSLDHTNRSLSQYRSKLLSIKQNHHHQLWRVFLRKLSCPRPCPPVFILTLLSEFNFQRNLFHLSEEWYFRQGYKKIILLSKLGCEHVKCLLLKSLYFFNQENCFCTLGDIPKQETIVYPTSNFRLVSESRETRSHPREFARETSTR